MTPRPLVRMRGVALVLAVMASLTAMVGCDPRMALYFLQPNDPSIAPPCPPLKGKRVVVLTRTSGLNSEFLSVDRDITDKLVKILRENVKKIDIVSPEKVREWARSKPTLTDPAEAARAFEADVVVSLDIQQFQIQSPVDIDMFQGRSSIHVQVTELDYPKDDRDKPMKDKDKESTVLYDGDLSTEFPSDHGIPIGAGTSKAEFKNRFMKQAVEELSWQFIDHAPGDSIQNSRFNSDN